MSLVSFFVYDCQALLKTETLSVLWLRNNFEDGILNVFAHLSTVAQRKKVILFVSRGDRGFSVVDPDLWNCVLFLMCSAQSVT